MLTITSMIWQLPLRPCTIMLVVPTAMPTRYSVRGDTSVACTIVGLPSVRLRTASASGSRADLPTGTTTLVCSWTAPVQSGPRSGAADPPAGVGAAASIICPGTRPPGKGVFGRALASAGPSNASCAMLPCATSNPAHSAEATTTPPSERPRFAPPDENPSFVFISSSPIPDIL